MSEVQTVLKPKHAGGRPPIYRVEFCERIIEYGKMGYSQAQMAAQLDVSKQTITDWAKQHTLFSDALTRARTFSQSWWEAKAQDGLENKDFNAGLWDKSVKSRFREDYTDRTVNEMVGKDGEELKLGDSSDAARAIAFMLVRAIGRQEKASETKSRSTK
jgi:transcriptional regulator with XRE-family HTH domain